MIKVTDGQIILDPDSIHYPIYLDECKTASDLDRWMKHLREKSWITPLLLSEFVDAVTAYQEELDE